MTIKRIAFTVLFLASVLKGQTPLPWGQVTNIPVLAATPGNVLFYVSSYTSTYTRTAVHTDYDYARRDADAYLQAHPDTPTYLILSPAATQTCDDVPLPVVTRANGMAATISILGYGSALSSVQKRPNCAAATSTLLLQQSAAARIQNAVFQGFTIDANHVDVAACGFYGVSRSTFFDVACGNAQPGADHEMEFGNDQAPTAGQDSLLNLYNLKAFDSVGVGKGALLTPQWNKGSLVSVSVINQGTKAYSRNFSRAQIVGPGLNTCSSVPVVTPVIDTTKQATFSILSTVSYGYISGAIVVNGGDCVDTTHLYILLQDGVPVTTGMKFSNMVHSHVWNLEPTGATKYGELWMPLSGSNTIIGEHPYTNQTIQIADYASANQHENAFFDSPGVYGAALYGPSGSFTNAVFSWDSISYVGSSGYLLGQNYGASSRWQISNSQCTNSTSEFVAITWAAGSLANSATPPSRNVLKDIEVCDGTNTVAWPSAVSPM